MKRLTLLFLILGSALVSAQAQPAADNSKALQPDKTLCFAHRDTCDLFLDFYAAAPDAGPCADSLRKPVIVHVFGGAFMIGRRNQPGDQLWYRKLADAGYHVAAIDYRLGLKGVQVKPNLSALPVLMEAIQMAVDDLYSATNYLLENAESLSIDPGRIIVTGSSAGAITALQAEWEICTGREPAKVLPAWFNYAGIISFSGAVFSMDGPVNFPQKPCPLLLMHGTADKTVPYGKISIFRNHFLGSDALSRKLTEAGANFQILRFKDAGHEVAASAMHNLPEELRFLEENMIRGSVRQVDALILDSNLPYFDWANLPYRKLTKAQEP